MDDGTFGLNTQNHKHESKDSRSPKDVFTAHFKFPYWFQGEMGVCYGSAAVVRRHRRVKIKPASPSGPDVCLKRTLSWISFISQQRNILRNVQSRHRDTFQCVCSLTRHICADVTSCTCVVSLRLPLSAVGLAPARHRVADAGSGARVHVLHHDEGMLLQGGDGQVTVIGHLLQEAAVPRPDRVADLKDPSRVRTHLERENKNSV